MSPRRFQILSLDGGGYRGMFSAAFLARIEQDLRVRIADHFDLIVGTSTGGIIALGLGASLSPTEITEFYVEHGPGIFGGRRRRTARQLLRSKYPPHGLRQALQSVFGDKRFGDSATPLCLPAYDLRNDDVVVFRTPHDAKLRRDWRESMVDVALATSAAPTYLPATSLGDRRLVDGGVWANNPTIVGLSEAVSVFKVALDQIHILSVGTTAPAVHRKPSLDHGGFLQWGTSVTEVLIRGQSRAATNAATLMLPQGHIVRVDPVVPANVLSLDRVNPPELAGLAEHHARIHSNDIETQFCHHTPQPYTPYYR